MNNNLILLTASAVNLKTLSKQLLEKLINESKEKLSKEDITDKDRYILNHKINVIEEIGI